MFRWNLVFASTLLLLCHLSLPAQAKPIDRMPLPVKGDLANYLSGLELHNSEDFPGDDDTRVVSASNDKIIIKLGLGETLNKTIILQPHTDTLEFKVEQSFETSLTIMNEGPHMDLLDWQHYVANWEELPCKNDSTFIAHEVSSTNFPVITTDEIVSAVAAESAKWANDGYDPGDRWLAVAKECKAPDAYPCGISVSKVFLRIMVNIAAQWQQIMLIEFIVPMGC